MHQSQLGFVPALISLGVALLGSKKQKKAAEQAAEQARQQGNMEAISSGNAVAAIQVMTEQDRQTLRALWPKIRAVTHFALIDWAKAGGNISPLAKTALAAIWPDVRQVESFGAVKWEHYAVPITAVAAQLPVPELPDHMQPGPVRPGPQGRILGQPIQAGLFEGEIPTPYLLAGGVALLLILSRRL